MMVDPTRMAVYGVYSKELNTMDPYLLAYVSLQRQYGYAPPIISEGFAGYFSFPVYDVRRLKQAGRSMPLDSLLRTFAYLKSDPTLADRTAAAFVRYLIDAYGVDTFLALYKSAHDLNLTEELTRVYGKPVTALQAEFDRYVDTLTWSSVDVANAHDLSRAMMNTERALDLAREGLRIAAGPKDTVDAWRRVARSAFEAGDYYTAVEAQRSLCRLDSGTVSNYFTLASNLMMVGEYAQADAWLDSAAVRDSSNQLVSFSRALGYQSTGRIDAARRVLERIVARPMGTGGLTESRILLAHILLQSGDDLDKHEAHNHATQAMNEIGNVQVQRGASSYRFLWMGMAMLAKGDTNGAWEMLQSGLFMENRPFYEGMFSLWLGKVSDVRGERDVARDYYGRVVTGATADYHQREARRYLESPYSQ
jgi:tetratricopeptide (TPR) repeat protein